MIYLSLQKKIHIQSPFPPQTLLCFFGTMKISDFSFPVFLARFLAFEYLSTVGSPPRLHQEGNEISQVALLIHLKHAISSDSGESPAYLAISLCEV